jgi:hypothetical protein
MLNRRTFLASMTAGWLVGAPAGRPQETTSHSEAPRFSVRRLHGVNTIYHYDRPVLPMLHFAITMTAKAVADFDGAGIDLFTFHLNTGPDASPYAPRTDCYPLQTASLDEIANYILKQNPNSYLMPRVLLWGPRNQGEWEAQNPGESYLNHPALGSIVWKTRAEEDLRRLLRHIEASSFADRVLGYHVGWGTCGEWMYWGWDRPASIDRSTATVRAFRQWLKFRYRGKTAQLRAAWKNPTVDFDNAGAPSDADLRHADFGMFIDPARTRIVPDYYEFLSDLNVDLIQFFGQVVKAETKAQALYGVFFGYDIHSDFNDYRLRASAHCGLGRVLGMPEVDFICSPNGYYDRGIGGMDFPQGVVTSIQLHGKVYFNETDTWTYLAKPDPDPNEANIRVKTPRDTREVLRRNFCQSLVEGCALWWMTNEANGYWYSAPEILQDLAQMARLYRFGLETERESIAQTAVVVDDRSPFYLKLDPEQNVMNPFVLSQFYELRRMGTPYDTLILEDVVRQRARPYKLYIFLDVFVATAAERESLHKTLRENRATAVWLYAAGLIGSSSSGPSSLGLSLDLKNMQALTAIRIAADPIEGSLDLRIKDADHPLTRRLGRGFSFEANRHPLNSLQERQPKAIVCSPIFFADDPQATTLGVLAANNKPGYVLKPMEGWRSIYMSGGPAPAAVWREVARYAGVPILNEDPDVFYADRSWLALHTGAAGSRRIRLPFRAERVCELFSRTVLSGPTNEFEIDVEKWKTYLFYFGANKSNDPWAGSS